MRVDSAGVGIEVAVRGPEDGPPVLFLHGWPDRGSLWTSQIDALSSAGFRTVAPDLRGFGDSDRPDGVEHYGLPFVLSDTQAVLDELGIERTHVVGHDWGAAVAWALASFAPERVDHLVAMSVGHPRSFRDAGLEQRRLSWYMLLFQFDGIAEEWLSRDDWSGMRELGATHADLERVIADASRRGALTAGLSWYRANVPPASLVAPPVDLPPVAAPTMGIWSSGDLYLTEQQMTGSAAHVAGGFRYERVDGASHWLQLDRPDEVNRLLLDFIPSARTEPRP